MSSSAQSHLHHFVTSVTVLLYLVSSTFGTQETAVTSCVVRECEVLAFSRLAW